MKLWRVPDMFLTCSSHVPHVFLTCSPGCSHMFLLVWPSRTRQPAAPQTLTAGNGMNVSDGSNLTDLMSRSFLWWRASELWLCFESTAVTCLPAHAAVQLDSRVEPGARGNKTAACKHAFTLCWLLPHRSTRMNVSWWRAAPAADPPAVERSAGTKAEESPVLLWPQTASCQHRFKSGQETSVLHLDLTLLSLISDLFLSTLFFYLLWWFNKMLQRSEFKRSNSLESES